MSFKSKLSSAIGILLLVGCAAAPTQYDLYKAGQPLNVGVYKAGTNMALRNRDITNCQVRAAQQVPQRQVISSSTGFTTPVQTTCNRIGTQVFCNSTGGQTYGGGITTNDANAGLRTRVTNQCLADKGYVSVNIPPCPVGVSIKYSEALPKLSPRTCYVADPAGRTAIGYH